MGKRLGRQTVRFSFPPRICGYAAVGGKKEGEGPLGKCFDYVSEDSYFGEQSWEKAESHMLRQCFSLACDKAKTPPSELDYIFSGDLLNQCISSAFAMRDTAVPYFGTYGACSTMAETLSLGAMLIDGGFAGKVCALTGSHFCSAERQYRFPLEYGALCLIGQILIDRTRLTPARILTSYVVVGVVLGGWAVSAAGRFRRGRG